MFNWFKKKEPEEIEQNPLDYEIEQCIKTLHSYSPDTPDYKEALDSLERLTELRKDICGEDEKTKWEVFKSIINKLWEGVTDPRVIVGVISSLVYIWWGKSCMYYDHEGNIPPNRMLSNGPKPPKQY